jgi:tetratricopeptide (TPR) repeat protein
MRYMKLLGLEMMVFAIGATVLFGQGNQEAANLTREGIEASKANDWDKAIAAFKRAAQLDEKYAPNLASALQQRATVYVSQGKFQEAITDYSEALKVKAKDPDIFERRAYAEMQLKNYDRALHDYSEAIKLSPEETKYYQVRALIFQTKGDFKAALADVDKILTVDPKNQDALQRKKFLEAKLHAPPTPPPTPSGPIPNPNVRPPATATATPATKPYSLRSGCRLPRDCSCRRHWRRI